MKPLTILELLLIFLLIAFAAYARVIDPDDIRNRGSFREAKNEKQSNLDVSLSSLKQATDNVNKYCACNENVCNCCREFHIPLVQVKGPGCASLQYMHGDNLAVQLSFGENILTSTIVKGKNPQPVCVPLPGGFSKFCGRIYSIKREADNHFKACLGLELQSATDLEASLRVSCFRFGPDGLKLRPAEPLPVVETEAPVEEDDDDIFGFGSDEDDDDENDDDDGDEEEDATNLETNVATITSSLGDEDDEDEDDVLGFSALLNIFTGDEEFTTKKPKTSTPSSSIAAFTIPLLSTSVNSFANDQNSMTTKQPAVEISTVNKIKVSTGTNNLDINDKPTVEALESSAENSDSEDTGEVLATSRNQTKIKDTEQYEALNNH
ncbi:uncharacterized protein LOC117171617 isoform X2 [Belonocnema kinseyi]|uniref:uncharacterized protein LOC117171617 isoform X2 n=1 Tax=Belonocnema kinseyi TaxID=2817044 RepID=UPI00143D97B0|nr:uncharacterized protein LOC117171617 isoform X2 [Belonocnema kinseyi]